MTNAGEHSIVRRNSEILRRGERASRVFMTPEKTRQASWHGDPDREVFVVTCHGFEQLVRCITSLGFPTRVSLGRSNLGVPLPRMPSDAAKSQQGSNEDLNKEQRQEWTMFARVFPALALAPCVCERGRHRRDAAVSVADVGKHFHSELGQTLKAVRLTNNNLPRVQGAFSFARKSY